MRSITGFSSAWHAPVRPSTRDAVTGPNALSQATGGEEELQEQAVQVTEKVKITTNSEKAGVNMQIHRDAEEFQDYRQRNSRQSMRLHTYRIWNGVNIVFSEKA